MKIAVIMSAGGAPFFEVVNACPHIEFDCITDRDCGAERAVLERGISHARIEDESNEGFSRKAASKLDGWGPHAAIITLYGRLLTPPLVGSYPMLNIHPSLLPAFPGFGAVRAAKNAGTAELGATLHGMSMRPDQGEIVAQVRGTLNPQDSLERLQKISFVQKLYVFLVAVELLENDALRFESGLPIVRANLPSTPTANPSLTDPRYTAYVQAVCRREGVAPL
jgi:phosphoribosylglycinamide formyltransferase-1